MHLQQFALRWMELYQVNSSDAPYGGLIGHSLIEIISLMAHQGHSGGSFAVTMALLNRLVQDYSDPRCDVWSEYYNSPEGQQRLREYGVTYENICSAVSKTEQDDEQL